MIMIKTLKQRLALFLILPVALILFITGFFGFVYVKQIMLDEWRESAVLKLQRAAHQIDMRLGRPIELMEMFQKTVGSRERVQTREWLLDQLKEMEGVTEVNLNWTEERIESPLMMRHGQKMDREAVHAHLGRIFQVTPPSHDSKTGQETVILISEFKDESGRLIGSLHVSVRFDYLMQDIIRLGWWESELACLVDESGLYLAHTKAMKHRTRLGEMNDHAELAVLEEMKKKPFGTVLGAGNHTVSGFSRIAQAPWIIVMFAPGEKILAPIVQFRLYYTLAGVVCIIFILLLIRFVGGGMVRSITDISQAARQVAKGDYGDPIPVKNTDELGQLTQSFNAMVEGLKERDLIQNTFGRYIDQEIAQELIRHPEAARLGGKKREVAILMSDIRGFTPLSESLTPEEVIRILNHYFSHMIEVIRTYRGIIVDFFGDGLLAFFDPLDGPVEPTAIEASRCALEMQKRMETFNKEMMKKNLPQLEMGIGLNAGEVVVGNIGSEARAKYGIVGSAVNVTARIQSEAKGGEIVLSGSIYRHISDTVQIGRTFEASLKGIENEVTLYVMKALSS